MAGVILNGSTSGSVTLDPPAVAGSTVITLPSTSGTMAKLTDIPAAQWTTTGSDIYYSTGNVGIGNSSMGSFNTGYNNLVVGSGTGNEGLAIYAGSASSCYLGFKGAASTSAQGLFEYDCGANDLYTYVNGTVRRKISSAGRQYFLNAGSPVTVADCIFNFAGTFAANRGISLNSTDSATSGEMFYFTTQSTYRGNIVCSAGGTAYNTSSDYRLKNNIAPMTGALAKVALLKPSVWSWKDTGDTSEGFIAHELAEVIPLAVTGEKDAVDSEGNPKYQGVDTSFLVATLTAAIQEQQALIENLTTRLSALENK